jgi:hypothetical protein
MCLLPDDLSKTIVSALDGRDPQADRRARQTTQQTMQASAAESAAARSLLLYGWKCVLPSNQNNTCLVLSPPDCNCPKWFVSPGTISCITGSTVVLTQ